MAKPKKRHDGSLLANSHSIPFQTEFINALVEPSHHADVLRPPATVRSLALDPIWLIVKDLAVVAAPAPALSTIAGRVPLDRHALGVVLARLRAVGVLHDPHAIRGIAAVATRARLSTKDRSEVDISRLPSGGHVAAEVGRRY